MYRIENSLVLKLGPWFCIVLLINLYERYLKVFCNQILQYGECLKLLSFLDLTLIYNRGIAFSLFTNQIAFQRLFLIILGITASIIIIKILFYLKNQIVFKLSLSMILSGVIGNTIDRIIDGYVTDFILIKWNNWSFPVFNLSDFCISLGLIIFSCRKIFLRIST